MGFPTSEPTIHIGEIAELRWQLYRKKWQDWCNSPDISEQDREQSLPAYRKAWQRHWIACGQPWRTKPEINKDRQNELRCRLANQADIDNDEYHFKEFPLNRADVEWLLANHTIIDINGQKKKWMEVLETWEPLPPGQAKRGLDLRGAILCDTTPDGEPDKNLYRLPLTELIGSLPGDIADETKREAAAIHLEGADLRRACLWTAALRSVHLEGADLRDADLRQAALDGAHLDGADLRSVYFDHATSLQEVHLDENTRVANIYWDGVNLEGVKNWPLKLGDETAAEKAGTLEAYQEAASANHQLAVALRDQGLNKDSDRFAYRAETNQRRVRWLHVLKEINQLETNNVLKTSWISQLLYGGYSGGKLSLYVLTTIASVLLLIAFLFVALGLSVFMSKLKMIFIISGVIASIPLAIYIIKESKKFRLLAVFIIASLIGLILFLLISLLVAFAIVNPQITLFILIVSVFCCIGLKSRISEFIKYIEEFTDKNEFTGAKSMKGMLTDVCMFHNIIWNDIFDFPPNTRPFFAFLKIQIDYGRYLFSLFLDTLIGYGYKPLRGLLWYLFIITTFAVAFHVLGSDVYPRLFPNAFVLSVISFHGRGFFAGIPNHPNIDLGSPLTVLAALEATIGLGIEVSFIATFTQRFFGK